MEIITSGKIFQKCILLRHFGAAHFRRFLLSIATEGN